MEYFINNPQVFWWIIAVVLLVVEFITPMTVFIFPAIVAALVGLLAFATDNITLQASIFFVASTALIVLLRPLFVTNKAVKGYKQGSEALIGQELRVVEEIDNTIDQGKVKHASDIFPARNVEKGVISEGSMVIVESVEGITLNVKKINNI